MDSKHNCRAASAKALLELDLDCAPSLIRNIWKAESAAEVESLYPGARAIANRFHHGPDLWTLKRECINKAAGSGFHGVEYLGEMKRARPWPVHVYYCNTGDTYAGTILFIGPRMVVGCWGDLVERGSITGRGDE
jgi:hypothetical protein